MTIKDHKLQLKEIIKSAVMEKITVLTKLFPGNAESLNAMKTDAKGEGNAVVYITYAGRKYGQKTGMAYHPYESFIIYLFSKVYNDDSQLEDDIEILLETVTDAIYKSRKDYDFHGHIINPVFTEKKDFYMAVLEIGRFLPVYPY